MNEEKEKEKTSLTERTQKLAGTRRSAFLKITLTKVANERDCKFYKNHCNSMQHSGLETRELEMRGGGGGGGGLMGSRMRFGDGRFQRKKEL